MSNTDVRTNHRVACSMGLAKEIKLAEHNNRQKLYPYVVIDRTNHARVSGIQVYTDIISKHKEAIFNNKPMKVIPGKEFNKKFEINDGFAKKRDNIEYTINDLNSSLDSQDSSDSYEPNSDLELPPDSSDDEFDEDSALEIDERNEVNSLTSGSHDSDEASDDEEQNTYDSEESSQGSDDEESDSQESD